MNTILKYLIKKHKVITFDIFDTLVERDVISPFDIFRIAGKEIIGERYAEEFCNARIEAERKARVNSENGEVTLNEIYDYLGDKYFPKGDMLKQEEIRQEIMHCIKKRKMDNVFEYAINCGCKVYLISDMYLPQCVIEKMLYKCGIKGYIKCFISNEQGKNKISGELFKIMMNEEKIKRKDILHIGDSVRADIVGAWKQGITPFLIGRKNRIVRIYVSLKRKMSILH